MLLDLVARCDTVHRIEQRERGDIVTRALRGQAHCDRVGEDPAHGPPDQMERSVRMHGPDFLDVASCQLRHRVWIE
ncbi:hypothetical protein BJF84_10295 [Rhodococcus sp. CUA-806]|nr:hypothetical protein BJF84_10295 [Rhodococcus sp. CUA-806]